jgi:PPOX class probable F420-dependent enzyme
MTHLEPAAIRLLEGPSSAHLATLLPDGSPHCVPLWVGLERDKVAFMTGPDSRKARNIAQDPRVAISITERGDPFTMAMIRGRVNDRIDGEAAWAIIDRISTLYTGRPYPEPASRIVFLVEPEHVVTRAF